MKTSLVHTFKKKTRKQSRSSILVEMDTIIANLESSDECLAETSTCASSLVSLVDSLPKTQGTLTDIIITTNSITQTEGESVQVIDRLIEEKDSIENELIAALKRHDAEIAGMKMTTEVFQKLLVDATREKRMQEDVVDKLTRRISELEGCVSKVIVYEQDLATSAEDY